MVLEAHKRRVEPVLGEDKYQSIVINADFLKEFNSLSRSIGGVSGIVISPLNSRNENPKYLEKRAKYNEMFKKICDEQIIATRNSLEHSEEHKAFIRDNEGVLDLLSSVVDMDYPYALQLHTKKYYESNPKYQVGELWANLFALKVTGREDLLFEFSKYLPDTFYAFEEVFDRVIDFYQLRACFGR